MFISSSVAFMQHVALMQQLHFIQLIVVCSFGIRPGVENKKNVSRETFCLTLNKG